MKLLFDFFPILLFFIAFKLFNIYIATATTMLAAVLQVLIYWLKNRRFESLHIITLITVVLLGSTTLLLHNDLFIKWKPTALYWTFAVVFFFSQFIGQKPIIQRLLDAQLSLPRNAWQRLNVSWVVFFIVMGLANIYVLYHFSTNTWVNFKLFGTLGLTVIFLIAQAIYMSKFMGNKNNPTVKRLLPANNLKSSNDDEH